MTIKTSQFSGNVHRAILKAGETSGLDTTAAGAAVGAVAGGVQGSFSDYGGLFGGATKGAIAGGFGGVGLKYAGSRYSKGLTNTLGDFDLGNVDHLTKASLNQRMSPNTKYFGAGKFDKNESWFSTQYTAFQGHKAASDFYNTLI